MSEIEQQAHVQAVQEKYTDELMRKRHVVGVAMGMAQKDGAYTQELAVVVMVDQKIPSEQLAPEDRVPAELDGVRVDVQETGAFVAQ